MPTIKELKEDLQFNAELIGLMDVMKNTAVFQFRALQESRGTFDKFFEAITGFFRLIGSRGAGHPLLFPASTRKTVIIISSDEGFIGDLNARVINTAALEERFTDAELIVVGERGARNIRNMGRQPVFFAGAADSGARRSLASAIGDYVIDGVRQGKFGKVTVVYPVPVSFMIQRVEIVELLPLGAGDTEGSRLGQNYSSSEVEKHNFALARTIKIPSSREDLSLIVESPIDKIIDYLAEKLIKHRLVDILESGKLAEFAARAIHLEGSSQQLTEKKAKVRLQYFKAYHELIDKSTRELFSSQVIIHGRS